MGDGGTILKTCDGGLNWIGLSSGTTYGLKSAFFTDINTGYAVGDSGTILKTINGGSTWTALAISTNDNIESVFFANASTGFVVYNYIFEGYYCGTILKTTDGGETWMQVSNVPYNMIQSLYFSDANNGYAVGGFIDTYYGYSMEGTILRTTDGGTTWTTISSSTINVLTSVYFTEENTGYAVGGVL